MQDEVTNEATKQDAGINTKLGCAAENRPAEINSEGNRSAEGIENPIDIPVVAGTTDSSRESTISPRTGKPLRRYVRDEESKIKQDTELTRRQKRFVSSMVETGKIGASAMRVGYDPSYGSMLMKQPKILTALQVAMEKAGITDEALAKKIQSGLNATYPPKSKDGKQYPDYFTRGTYVDRALKVRGDLIERTEVEHRHIIINFTPDLVKGLLDAGIVDKDEIMELVKQGDGVYSTPASAENSVNNPDLGKT
jgi:hypothetical protein